MPICRHFDGISHSIRGIVIFRRMTSTSRTAPTVTPLLPLMTTSQVAEVLGLSAETIRDMAADGRLPCVRLSTKSLRFRQTDVAALMVPVGADAA